MNILDYLIEEAISDGRLKEKPHTIKNAFALYRSLANTRPPKDLAEDVLRLDDVFLQKVREMHTITKAEELSFDGGFALWQGDITTLAADGIVNAANSAMLGCFIPHHACIDNCIHTYAGLRLRLACKKARQALGGREAHTAEVIATKAFNLSSRYVFHVTGPIVQGALTHAHEEALAACYRNVFEKAVAMNIKTLAYCSISTGVFGYPVDKACKTAMQTVREAREKHGEKSPLVIFNVFSDADKALYEKEWENLYA